MPQPRPGQLAPLGRARKLGDRSHSPIGIPLQRAATCRPTARRRHARRGCPSGGREPLQDGPTLSGVGEHRFEGLASEVVGTYLNEGGRYRKGWITKRSGDGGIDFVGRLDLGAVDNGLKLVVLGQAKCRAVDSPGTGGLDLARTVARLSRGWVGAFVTTGHYTVQAQREVIDDRLPLAPCQRSSGRRGRGAQCRRAGPDRSGLHLRDRRRVRRAALESSSRKRSSPRVSPPADDELASV